MIKKIETEYKKARKRASKYNDQLKTVLGASELIGVSRDTLINYELGRCKRLPVDSVKKMAEVYKTPELLNYYCRHECPIGKVTIQPINQKHIDNICMLGININNFLEEENSTRIRLDLLKILADGEISKDEIPLMKQRVNELKEFVGLIMDLVVAAEKNIYERKDKIE